MGAYAGDAAPLFGHARRKRSLFAFPFQRRPRGASVPSNPEARIPLRVGDLCLATSPVTLRQAEDLESEHLDILPPSTLLVIVRRGDGRRVKVAAEGGVQGWVSCVSSLGHQLLTTFKDERGGVPHGRFFDLRGIAPIAFPLGGDFVVASEANLRAGEELDSWLFDQLRPGAIVRILEHGVNNPLRAKVSLAGGLQGWMSLATRNGDLLVRSSRTASLPLPATTVLSRPALRLRSRSWPAVAIVRASGRRLGDIVQAMRPPVGRRWLSASDSDDEGEGFYAAASRLFWGGGNGSPPSPAEPGSPRGLKQSCATPTRDFIVGEAREAKFGRTCSICLQDMVMGDRVRQLPCDHMFHAACVDVWLHKAHVCPMRCPGEVVLPKPRLDPP